MSTKNPKPVLKWVLIGRACVLLAFLYAILFSFALKYWPPVPTIIQHESPVNHVEVLKPMDGPPDGAGKNGEPVYLRGDGEMAKLKLIRKQTFNVYVSDKISYNRSIPDNRDTRCTKIEYDADLPMASVIIPFHNEAWSGLMRTLWTVVIRSPVHLLREILLIEDLSDKEEFREKLDHYVASHFHNVRVIHLRWRRGIVGARNVGAEAATGDVLVFLEALSEAGHKWLEPLLQRVMYRPNDIAIPRIDEIDCYTLGYRQRGPESFGNFTWQEHVSWRPHLVQKQNFDQLSPSDSEGIFAISRKRFWEIHAEEKENLELSFRLWVCGGTFEFIPCSRVGNVAHESSKNLTDKKGAKRRPPRLAERWITDFKHLVYNHDQYSKSLKDITLNETHSRRTLQQKLHCDYFLWYLDQFFPKETLLEETVEEHGKIVSEGSRNCIDTLMRDPAKHEPLGIFQCQSNSKTQVFTISCRGEIRFNFFFCFDVFGTNDSAVRLSECIRNKGSQEWSFFKGGSIVHSTTNKCLQEASRGRLEINNCRPTKFQEWKFQSFV